MMSNKTGTRVFFSTKAPNTEDEKGYEELDWIEFGKIANGIATKPKSVFFLSDCGVEIDSDSNVEMHSTCGDNAISLTAVDLELLISRYIEVFPEFKDELIGDLNA